jgi:predicted transcriptional regulator
MKAAGRRGQREQDRLLTDEELEKLTAMADAMSAIAGNNLPGMVDRLSDRIRQLRKMVEEQQDASVIQELAEELNSSGVLNWVKALEKGDLVIDELVLKLVDANEDGDAD